MDNYDKAWRTIPTTNGLYMLGCLIAYFLVMRTLGMAEIYWLRALNFIFVMIFVRNALLSYRNGSGASYYDDFSDMFKIGVRTSFIGIGAFSVFMALYLDQVDHEFMNTLAVKESFGGQITAVSAAFIVFIEGMVSAMAGTFVLLQLYKSKVVNGAHLSH